MACRPHSRRHPHRGRPIATCQYHTFARSTYRRPLRTPRSFHNWSGAVGTAWFQESDADGRWHGGLGGRTLRGRARRTPVTATADARLGLQANWQQFTLLVVINAFVGAMVGLERTIVPLIAGVDFNLASKAVTLSFLVSFGVVKAMANLFAGRMSDRI